MELKAGPSRRETRPMDAIPDEASILLPHYPKQGWNNGWRSCFCAFWSQFSPSSLPKPVIKDRDSRDGFPSLKPQPSCSTLPQHSFILQRSFHGVFSVCTWLSLPPVRLVIVSECFQTPPTCSSKAGHSSLRTEPDCSSSSEDM